MPAVNDGSMRHIRPPFKAIKAQQPHPHKHCFIFILRSTLTITNVALGTDEVVAELRVYEGGTGSSSSNKREPISGKLL